MIPLLGVQPCGSVSRDGSARRGCEAGCERLLGNQRHDRRGGRGDRGDSLICPPSSTARSTIAPARWLTRLLASYQHQRVAARPGTPPIVPNRTTAVRTVVP